MSSEALKSILKYDPQPKLDDYDDLTNLIDRVSYINTCFKH